jgi:polyisoprenoid-binding protein YceI
MFTRIAATVTLTAALAIAAVLPALASPWAVVPTESKIAFSGEHAGTKFKGTFEKWDAVIAFDPANLAASKATVTVQLASAKTGDTTYDKTLPTLDWFDIAKGPTGVFETTGFRALGADKYEADATLSLRGIKMPVVFTFDFKATGDTAKLIGKAEVKRMDFGIGKTSDATGAWVSLSIPLEVTVGLKKG